MSTEISLVPSFLFLGKSLWLVIYFLFSLSLICVWESSRAFNETHSLLAVSNTMASIITLILKYLQMSSWGDSISIFTQTRTAKGLCTIAILGIRTHFLCTVGKKRVWRHSIRCVWFVLSCLPVCLPVHHIGPLSSHFSVYALELLYKESYQVITIIYTCAWLS